MGMAAALLANASRAWVAMSRKPLLTECDESAQPPESMPNEDQCVHGWTPDYLRCEILNVTQVSLDDESGVSSQHDAVHRRTTYGARHTSGDEPPRPSVFTVRYIDCGDVEEGIPEERLRLPISDEGEEALQAPPLCQPMALAFVRPRAPPWRNDPTTTDDGPRGMLHGLLMYFVASSWPFSMVIKYRTGCPPPPLATGGPPNSEEVHSGGDREFPRFDPLQYSAFYRVDEESLSLHGLLISKAANELEVDQRPMFVPHLFAEVFTLTEGPAASRSQLPHAVTFSS